MKTCTSIKINSESEDYLTTLSVEHRRSFSRFRISSHNLAIERGRYTRPPIPVQDRT